MKLGFALAFIVASLALVVVVGQVSASPINATESFERRSGGPIPYDQISIENIVYGGSGCPAGTAHWQLSADKQVVTVLYDQFDASVGPGVPIFRNREFCQLNVKIHYPQGLSFTITKLDARGFAQLEEGTHGSHLTTFYFSGETQQASLKLNFPSPYDNEYVLTASLLDAQLVWCPCGANRNLNVKQSVSVENRHDRKKSAEVTVDSTDLKVEMKLHLQWKWC